MATRELSHYRILEHLGEGSMGTVYKAEDLRLQRLVALKLLPRRIAADAERRRLFLAEARAVARLDHPHICGIHDLEESGDGEVFLVMPYYPGETLARRIARGRLELTDAIVFAIQLAEALGAAHRSGVVHRDVKPGNVLVGVDGQLRLVDFGLTAWAPEEAGGRDGRTAGTLLYMSPEQVRGGELDGRSDLWSLGVVLFEMLAGRPPFTGAGAGDVLRAIVDGEPLRLEKLRPQVPPELVEIVDRCLAKDRERRYPAAEPLLEDLRRLRDELAAPTLLGIPSLPAEPSRESRRPRSPRQHRRRGSWAAAAAAVLLAGAATGWLLHARSAAAAIADSVAILPFANLTGDPSTVYLSDGLAAGLLNELSSLDDLHLVGRSESWRYRGRPPSEVGRLLGVASVVEGQVQQDGRLLRVAVSLTDTRSGRVRWAATFEGDRDGIFGLQHRIAEHLADMLELPPAASDRRSLVARFPQAHDAYLRGCRALDESADVAGAEIAAVHLRQALRLDPGFAPAHAALSEALCRISSRRSLAATAAEAEREARRAVALDPDLPSAQVALARALRTRGDTAESIAALRKALDRHPRPADAHRELGASYEHAGDVAQARNSYRTATALAPDEWRNWNALGSFLVRTGRYEDARQAYSRAVRLAPPDLSWPRENLAMVELFEGRFAEAAAAYGRLGTATADPVVASNMGTAYFFLGQLEAAERLYRRAVELDPQDPDVLRNLADLEQRRGRKAEARATYRRALALIEEALARGGGPAHLPVARAVLAAKTGDCALATA
ncbi:MAG TPA: protein kinase, partial [Thermoanaerobaculia bacterium]